MGKQNTRCDWWLDWSGITANSSPPCLGCCPYKIFLAVRNDRRNFHFSAQGSGRTTSLLPSKMAKEAEGITSQQTAPNYLLHLLFWPEQLCLTTAVPYRQCVSSLLASPSLHLSCEIQCYCKVSSSSAEFLPITLFAYMPKTWGSSGM